MDIDVFQLPAIIWRRFHYVILCVLVCVLLALAFVLTQKPFYRSMAEIYIDVQRGPVVGADTGITTDAQQVVASQIYVLQSRHVLSDVVKRLELEKDPYLAGGLRAAAGGDPVDRVVNALLDNLIVERAGDSYVFSITVKHRDGETAARIANAIGESYLHLSDASHFDASVRTSESIAGQTVELRKRVLDARAAVESFRTESGLLSTGQQGLITDQELAALNQQLIVARQQAEQQKTAYEQAHQLNLSAVESGAIPEALQSAALTALRNRYALMLDRQAELAANLGNGHPQMKAVRSQVASMKSAVEGELGRIREMTENTYERAKANLDFVQKRFDEQTAANGDNGKLRFRLAQLISEADALDAVYKAFLTRAEELGRQQGLDSGNSRIISQAVPSGKPIRAPRLLVLIAAVLFGTAAGGALAVLREILAGGKRPERDLEAKTGAPVLAVIEEERQAPARPGWSGKLARVVPFIREPAGHDGPPRISGFTRAAYLLDAQLTADGPVAVAVLSAGGAGRGVAAIGIAGELRALGKDVLFADGRLRAPERGLLPRSHGSVRISTATARLRDGGERPDRTQGLADLLQIRRLGAGGLRQVTALSSARVSTAVRDMQADILVIDCCGTPAEANLPAILRRVDAIVVVSAAGAAGGETLDALVAEIAPWRDRLVGNILVGDRAA